MNYRQIYREELTGPYLFSGSEKLLMDNGIIYLKGKIKNFKDFNIMNLQGKNLELGYLVSACETLPVMNDKKLIIVSDVAEFVKNIDFKKDLEGHLENFSSDTVLIFLDDVMGVNKNTSFYKYFKKKDRLVEFNTLNPREIMLYINGYFKKAGINISNSATATLVDKLGYGSKNLNLTLFDVKNELDKLISLYKREISIADIDYVVKENPDLSIFDFLDALTNRKAEEALTHFENLYNLNEPVHRILNMVIRNFHMLLGVKLGVNKSAQDVMSTLSIGNFEYGKFKRGTENFTADELINIYSELLEGEIKLKTSQVNEKVLMETIILKICNKKS